VIGALAFLWFLIRMRNDLRRAEGGTGDADLVRVLPPLGRLELLLGGGFFGLLVLLATATVIL
jgi:hypothetical protein